MSTEAEAILPAKTVKTIKTITVYVCPTPGCPDYFGSSGMPKLEDKLTGVYTEIRHSVQVEGLPPGMKHNRANCPTCRQAGRDVDRVPIRLNVTV